MTRWSISTPTGGSGLSTFTNAARRVGGAVRSTWDATAGKAVSAVNDHVVQPVVRTGAATVEAAKATTATLRRTLVSGVKAVNRRAREVTSAVGRNAGTLVGGANAVTKQIAGVAKGVYEGTSEMVGGLAQLASNPGQLAQLGRAFINDPLGTAKTLGDSVISPIIEDFRNGNYGEGLGRIGVGVFDVIFGAKGVGKLGRAGHTLSKLDVAPVQKATRTFGGFKSRLAEETGAVRFGRGEAPSTRPIHSRYSDGTPVFEGQQPARLGAAMPDPASTGSHSRLRWDGENGRVYQAREFDELGNPVRDIDFTGPSGSVGWRGTTRSSEMTPTRRGRSGRRIVPTVGSPSYPHHHRGRTNRHAGGSRQPSRVGE